jgi:transcriptional regulator GlxA family with amidase domain
MKIAIVAFDQFTDIDVFLAWDLFNRYRSDAWQVRLVGTATHHTSVAGLTIPIYEQIEWANEADIVFFSSGPGTRKLYNDAAYLSRFQLQPERQLIGSMCSGSLILAGLGLLKNTATTYPTSAELLRSLGVQVVEEDLVVHGNVATAAGCLAALELVGWMLERVGGTELKEFVINSVQPVTQGLQCSYGAPQPMLR